MTHAMSSRRFRAPWRRVLAMVVGAWLASPAVLAQSADSEAPRPMGVELERAGFQCPWSDCRGCEAYRRLCGTASRDLSALNAELVNLSAGYGPAQTEAGADPSPDPDVTGQAGAPGDPGDSSAPDPDDPTAAAPDPGPPATQSSHVPGVVAGDAHAIPGLGPFTKVLLGALLLLLGGARLRRRSTKA